MRSVAVGVIGHVNHGKTALVRALTGTETDRLAEEKARGLSMVLGFAHLDLPDGSIDLIDMPGHERFVRTMVAGAAGIGAVLLVVAASEGVRRQTVEHIEIARLIGIRHAVVAITKCDLVGPGGAAAVLGSVRAQLGDGALAAAPAVFVSALRGDGLPELRARLAELLRTAPPAADHGYPYLPVDRAFTIPGFGTIVTGTLKRGGLRVADEVEIVPGGKRARIRGLQIHGAPVATASPGQRVAVNLRGVAVGDIGSGSALSVPGMLVAADWLDVELSVTAGAPRPLETGKWLRLSIGTAERRVRLRLLGGDSLQPGQSGMAQLFCPDFVAAPAGEHFVLRSDNSGGTVGGGRLLLPQSRRRRRTEAGLVQVLAAAGPAVFLECRLREAGPGGAPLARLAREVGHAPERVSAWARRLGAPIFAQDRVTHPEAYRKLREDVLRGLRHFHRRQPQERGIGRDSLRRLLPEQLPAAICGSIIERMLAAGDLIAEEKLLRLVDFAPPPRCDERLAAEIAELFRKSGLRPPDAPAVVGSDRRCHIAVRELVRSGILLAAPDRVQHRVLLFHRDCVEAARRRLGAAFPDGARFSVGDTGRALGITRKYSVPLLEHFDAIRFTRRSGDLRQVLSGGSE